MWVSQCGARRLPEIQHGCRPLNSLAKDYSYSRSQMRFKTGGRDLRCKIESRRCG